MNSPFPKSFAIAVLLAAGPAFADSEHHSHAMHDAYAVGEPGDAKKPARIVQVTMTEADDKMLFVPGTVEIKKGEQVKFMLRNSGALDHEFVLATTAENLKHAEAMRQMPDTVHRDPNARTLAPTKAGDMVWKFSNAGTFEFACLIPGHRDAGMTGTIVVK